MPSDHFMLNSPVDPDSAVSITPALADAARTLLRMTTGVTLFLGGQISLVKSEVEWKVEPASEATFEFRDWVSGYAQNTEEVRAFCNAKKLMPLAQVAVSLATQFFPPGSKPSLRVEQDPESEEQWLVVDVAVKKGTANIFNCYKRMAESWNLQADAAARSAIHLTFHRI